MRKKNKRKKNGVILYINFDVQQQWRITSSVASDNNKQWKKKRLYYYHQCYKYYITI